MFIQYYDSPLGKILLAADEIGLIGVWFENQKYYANGLKEPIEEEIYARLKDIESLEELKQYYNSADEMRLGPGWVGREHEKPPEIDPYMYASKRYCYGIKIYDGSNEGYWGILIPSAADECVPHREQ